MASQSTGFEHAYTEMLGEELVVFGNFASLGKSGHSEASLARTLVVLAYKLSYGQLGENLEVSISRKDLSNLIDIAEENISRFLSAFKAEGLISTKGSRITLLKVNKLITLANEPLLE
ncbi:helix-turn-helix domain-containing protein [Pedobacter sp. GR22-6]|uniref:helix-turn-helix domain-containing protein n=1 Tax=Pedobacter sp. GR22-6 TaxID=3127957 RepID=UPI00307F11F0